MTMESPVRICLGAALVVTILLLCSTTANGGALPETTATTREVRIISRLSRTNTTLATRKSKTPDVGLNELHPKDSVAEEHTEKNAKYKDRGRIRYNLKPSTESSIRRVRTSTTTTAAPSSTVTSKLIIVTPTPEVKKPAQIIDGMKTFKKTKMPLSSSTTPISKIVMTEEEQEEEEYEDDEEEEVKESFEKYTSGKFDSNFFTIPNYNVDFHHDSIGSDNKVKSEYSSSPYNSFSSYFPEVSYDPNHHDKPYKVENFFDFGSDLTTPKNDFFDKKFHEISSSIIKNLDTIKSKQPPTPSTTNTYVIKENTKPEILSNISPKNQSTVIIKNTKEIRLLDNDKAGTANNKELSDVHGTSIYYEVSVLSTETYNLNSSDGDCDNDTLPADPTVGTSAEQELAFLKTTHSTPLSSTKPTPLSSTKATPLFSTKATSKDSKSEKSEAISTLSSNYLPFSSPSLSFFGTATPSSIAISTQNSVSSTEKSKRIYSSSFTRNRSYSKRLNSSGANDSPNNVTPRIESSTAQQVYRVPTRKFHYTTPKIKPVWMAPRRNVTRTSYMRSTVPTTIYSEYFSIKDKLSTSTPRSKQPSRTSLTTVSSEIDPVLQSDVSGVKKIVHSQAISDNSIPTLWKRGSTKFSSSTATSEEVESGSSDMEIPPTLTAWALASLRSTPVQASPATNMTASTQTSVDENELQKVGEMTDKKETTTTSTTTTTTAINNDIISEKYTELDQNRLPWRPAKPLIAPSTTNLETQTTSTVTESKSERQPAESNISFQSSKPKASTEQINVDSTGQTIETNQELVQIMETTTEEAQETIPPVDAPKSTGFESITKLPAGLTTPHDETTGSDPNQDATDAPTTIDYEITTIRFSYVPTETTESQEKGTTFNWHPVFPTRTKSTTIKDEPITTYRPKYITSTDAEVETTTVIPETTPALELSSQVVEHVTERPVTTLTAETTEEMELQRETTTEKLTVQPMTTTKRIPVETMPTSTTEELLETSTIIVEIATEINSERSKLQTTSTEISLSTEVSSIEVTETSPSEFRDSSSEENSGSNEVITQETTKMVPSVPTTTRLSITTDTTQETVAENEEPTTVTEVKLTTTQTAKSPETTHENTMLVSTTDTTTTEDVIVEVTTEASSRVLNEDSGSGAAVAIAVSTIGVIALILLVGLLLVVRRRGRRGVYAQRCTPVSLDAYSLDSVSVGHRKGNHRLRASKRSYGNPAYDDEVTSHPMQYAALANFALDVDSMSTEFAEIPSVTVRPDEVPPGCEDKNRYSNVLPLPETRVPLTRIANDHTTEYINANYITGPGNIRSYYIASQAPLPNTVVDFWRMVWEQNSRVIVMLTEYMENGVEKCYEYLPPSEVSDNKRTFGEYQIILMKREQRDKYAISSVQVINLATRTWREVTHLWYFWPAKGVPDDYESVLDFLSEMRSYMKIAQTAKEYDEEGVEVIYGDQSRSSFHNLSKLRSEENNSGNGVNVYSPARAEEQMRRGNANNGTLSRMKAASEVEGVRPCVVVCASGAGRSAALIAVDICTRALAAGVADVPRVVRELRAQRPHSLSNRHHYIFLYKVLSEYGNKLMGGGVDTI